MKIFSLVVLSFVAIPAYAQGLFDALEQSQAALPAAPGVTTERPATGITSPTVRPSDVDTSCSESKQTSLPLLYFTRLIRQPNAQLNITPDPASGTLQISHPARMIGNCNSMLQWNLRQNEVAGVKTYSIEIKFKDGESCPAEVVAPEGQKCYRVAKMKDRQFDKFEVKPFSNDIQGFQRCMEEAGVMTPAGIVDNAIYHQPVQETFSGVEETGRLEFVSHGPVSSQIQPRHELVRVSRCDVYEKIHPTIGMVYSPTDISNRTNISAS